MAEKRGKYPRQLLGLTVSFAYNCPVTFNTTPFLLHTSVLFKASSRVRENTFYTALVKHGFAICGKYSGASTGIVIHSSLLITVPTYLDIYPGAVRTAGPWSRCVLIPRLL